MPCGGAHGEDCAHIHPLCRAELAHAIAAREHHAVILDNRYGDAGDAQFLHGTLDLRVETGGWKSLRARRLRRHHQRGDDHDHGAARPHRDALAVEALSRTRRKSIGGVRIEAGRPRSSSVNVTSAVPIIASRHFTWNVS
jgi:hypothetical protein